MVKTRTAVSAVAYVGLGVALGIFGFLLFFAFKDGSPLGAKLIVAHAQYLDPISTQSIARACTAQAASEAIGRDELLSSTMSFYETVIQVLIAILALVAGSAYLYIWAASKKHIDEAAKDAVIQHVGTNEFHDVLRKYNADRAKELSDHLDAKVAEIEESFGYSEQDIEPLEKQAEDHAKEIGRLKESLARVEAALALLDKAETQGGDLNISDVGGGGGNGAA